MARKTTEDWLEEIDAALAYREMYGREPAWNKIEMNYMNDPEGDTAIGPNLTYSMGDSLVSALIVPDPEIIIKATKRKSLDRAPILESLDNYLVTKLRLKKYTDMAILRGYLTGVMILKIGYDSEFGWAPYYDIGQGNNLMGLTFTQFDKKGHRIESPDTQPGWPWIRPVMSQDFVVPWGTIYVEDAPWAAHRIIRHIDHIKKDPKYRNTSRLQGQITMEDFMESTLTVGSQKQRMRGKGIFKHQKKAEFVELWEIRDRLTGEILVVTRDYGSFLRRAPDAIQMACGMPFVCATLNQHPRSFWTTPPAYYLGQIQKTQFDISLQAEKQRRISVLKFLYRSGDITKEALSRFLSADVGAAEAVDSIHPLKDIIAPIQTGISWDSVAASENNRKDAREAMGFSRNQVGEFEKGRKTKAETMSVAEGAGRREGRRSQAIISLYIECIKKTNQLIFNFWNLPREVMHDEGFENVTGESLKGDYLYDVSLSTKRNVSRAQRQVEAMMMTAQLAQLPGIDPKALYQYLADASSDPAFERILAPVTSGGGGQRSSASLPTNPKQQQLPAGGQK